MTNVKVIAGGAFPFCPHLTNIEIPIGVTSIGDRAFSGCSNLTSIEIPSSVKSIGDSAFYNCSALTSIEIPSSVTSIGDSAFQYCNKLENITVDPSNANYCSDEYGVLFNKDKTELIQYPVGNTRTQYTIPSSVKSIEAYAFSFCSALETVTFGDKSQLESIGRSAFSSCSNLTGIEIPSSVTSIGDNAFSGCDKLGNITVDPSNANYCSDEYGVLFNKDKTELIQYPIGQCEKYRRFCLLFLLCIRNSNIWSELATREYRLFCLPVLLQLNQHRDPKWCDKYRRLGLL